MRCSDPSSSAWTQASEKNDQEHKKALEKENARHETDTTAVAEVDRVPDERRVVSAFLPSHDEPRVGEEYSLPLESRRGSSAERGGPAHHY